MSRIVFDWSPSPLPHACALVFLIADEVEQKTTRGQGKGTVLC